MRHKGGRRGSTIGELMDLPQGNEAPRARELCRVFVNKVLRTGNQTNSPSRPGPAGEPVRLDRHPKAQGRGEAADQEHR